jgi:hypothetical protein
VGMQPEKTRDAAQYATWWAQKFALLCIFFASQREAVGNKAKVLAIRESIFQSMVMVGEVSAAITILESPSRVKNFSCREATREAAS